MVYAQPGIEQSKKLKKGRVTSNEKNKPFSGGVKALQRKKGGEKVLFLEARTIGTAPIRQKEKKEKKVSGTPRDG